MMFRQMEWTDIPSGLSLCRSAGWNQLSRDWEIFITLNQQGNRVCVDDNGNVVGTVTTIRYGHHFAWIAMVLVDPAQQRKGIGLSLLEQATQILNDENCVKLDATPAGRQVYIKLGFADEYELSRMSAPAINVQHLIPSPTATVMTADDFQRVRSFDLEIFGAERMPLLNWMLDGAPELAFKVSEGDHLQGYCFGRYGYRYTHIGPVVANDIEVAESLVSAALSKCGDRPIILDVPHHNESWRDWLGSVGFSAVRTFIRMYKGNNLYPGIPENQYAILGPEFG
jgi:ribosomal protein S18 acetylase RimI-like enzyme